ncbi:hypothetical protein GCM10022288_06530 [Gryllotalpicola kribbensis]|uniref:VOC domain-containing protein n=1 Tax=Gryllotalpicola kribbensis TaxID=993084 RepID=A0ABP8AK88_9MICO
MRITDVVLPTRDLDATERFYRDRLEVPATRSGARLTVEIGASRLLFEQGDYAGSQHLAITIPTGSFADAKAWIATRAALLRDEAGADEFETSPAWNGRSVYFDGPDGQVLELIERRDLDKRMPAPFGPRGLLCISEVGIAVPDVPEAVERLRGRGVPPYGNPPGTAFAAVGDIHGLLILVAAGRAWMPTTDRRAQSAPITVRAEGVRRTPLAPDAALEPAS